MRVVLGFLFGFLFAAACSFGLTVLEVPVWPIVVMAAGVGFLITRPGSLRDSSAELIGVYTACFGAMFALSFPVNGSLRLVVLHQMLVATLLVLAMIAAVLGIFRAEAKNRPAIIWSLIAIGAGAFVAFISSDAGGADPLRQWLLHYISAPRADVAVFAIRKTIHITFYGTLAVLFAQAVRSHRSALVLAALFALGHGAFDEIRQAGQVHRTGSALDLVIDALGVALFLSVWNRYGWKQLRARP